MVGYPHLLIGRRTTPVRGLTITMVAKYLLTGMILQVGFAVPGVIVHIYIYMCVCVCYVRGFFKTKKTLLGPTFINIISHVICHEHFENC